ncbi:hypothetical protein [Specibacter sp. NPDC078692]|uniref:hypothetical protein n=1 Tax=Specibacter sp. NPDC078692 TaxID=3155818 RepID=UPI00342E4643
MTENPDYDDKDLINESPSHDHLAEVYSEMVTPDIEEINEHAAALAQESEREADQL